VLVLRWMNTVYTVLLQMIASLINKLSEKIILAISERFFCNLTTILARVLAMIDYMGKWKKFSGLFSSEKAVYCEQPQHVYG